MINKLVVILGPTASGKTSFAVQLADKINSEIISADSRQIYKGMDIGTGKDLEEYIINNKTIPYHLIDILSPNEDYSVYQFRNDFFECYNRLKDKNRNIILCGGTNQKLRKFYANMSTEDLVKELKKLNSKMYDPKFHTTNRRIIRSIEIVKNPIKNKRDFNTKFISDYIVFGIKQDREDLLKSIEHRLDDRFNNRMIEEVESLIENGLGFDRLKYFGLEYKIIGEYLFNVIDIDEMKLKLKFAINKFSKRQMTFFRRMEKRGIKINWIDKQKIQNIDLILKQYF